ncbi:MAG TPA: NADH-quinone oxidoreductase subunit N [bacterium]|jgi:NADH-quinone oxidoreductase subunit N
MMSGLQVDLGPLLPELIFSAGLLLLLIVNLVVKRGRGKVMAIGGVILLAVVCVFAMGGDESVGEYLFGSVVQDGVTVFFRIFFCAATALSLGLMVFSFPNDGEPFLLMLSSMLGMFLLAGSNDLVTLFVALELVSIPSYVLAGYKRNDVRSGEASLKYVMFGAMSSGLMLYGFSFLYGMTGSTSLVNMAGHLGKIGANDPMLLIALVLVLAGIGYKIAMVPMHFWCPDVYEGSPTAVTAFFSVVPKAAGFAALYRLMGVFTSLNTSWGVNALTLFTVASAVTMTFGNLGALYQTSLKRLLAYSSIAHAGYILMGFAVLASNPSMDVAALATQAIMFYLAVYLFMNFGAFLIVDLIERHTGGDAISYFRGLGRTNAVPALLLAVFLFSLTGIPPLAGFTGKFLLFAALVKGKLWALAMIGIANTVVSLYYYIRVIRDMFLYEPMPDTAALLPNPGIKFKGLLATLSLLAIAPTLILGLWWGPLAEWIGLKTW